MSAPEKNTHKITIKNDTWEITLFSRNGKAPHGYEMQRNDLSDTYCIGGLEIVKIGDMDMIEGYDGTYSLPVPVALLLANHGYAFAPFVFPVESTISY